MWILKFLRMKGTHRRLWIEKSTSNGLSLCSGVAVHPRVITHRKHRTGLVGSRRHGQLLSYIQTGWIWSVGGSTQMQMGNASVEPALTLWQGWRTAAWQHHMGYSLCTQVHKPSQQHMLHISISFTESACKVENAATPFIFLVSCSGLDFNGFPSVKYMLTDQSVLQGNLKLFTSVQ